MSLSKGFLRQKGQAINQQWIITGILLGMSLALVIYAFSIQLREVLRMFTFFFVDDLLLLENKELRFYNWFYAIISSIIGCSYSVKFIFQNSRNRSNHKIRLLQTSIITDQNFTTWSTINWMGKVFLITGIWFMTMTMHFDISFYDDSFLFLILFPISWFLNLWMSFIRLFKKKAYRYIGISLLMIVINSFLLTSIDIVDSEKMNSKLLANSIHNNYKLIIPSTETYSFELYQHDNIDLYLGFSKIDRSSTISLLGDYNHRIENELSIDEVHNYIFKKMDKLNELERYRVTVRLFIDVGTPMHKVQQLKMNISKAGIRTVLLETFPRNSKYPNHYPPFNKFGIRSMVTFNCDCEIDKIDSLIQLDYSSKEIRFPDSFCYKAALIKDYNRFLVTVDENDIVFLNGQITTNDLIFEAAYKLVKNHPDNYVVLLDPNDQSTYGKYMEVLDIIRSAIITNRNERSMALFGQPYRFSTEIYGDEYLDMRRIEYDLPMNIMEFNYTDKFLYEFLKDH